MGVTENKAAARKLIEEILNKGNVAAIDQLFGANYVEHGLPPGMPPGREGFKMFVTAYRTAFPDLKVKIEAEFGEGDLLAHRLMSTGTMKGEFSGMKPTARTALGKSTTLGALTRTASWWSTGGLPTR
jgi:predicted SnoaL-like aldol condensation-catalyzing enzyme